MSDPTPKNFAMGSLDMSIRDLLKHMMASQLDHAVLIIPGTGARISVTVATQAKTDLITREVMRILSP
jgi:hypothetical protein